MQVGVLKLAALVISIAGEPGFVLNILNTVK